MIRLFTPICLLLLGGVPLLTAQEPPVNPFKPRVRSRVDAKAGTVALSNGETIAGLVYVTRDKRLRIYDVQEKMYRDIPLVAVKRIDIRAEKEGIEKEWRWKEGGSNVKVYTGKAYPWRQYIATIVLTNDQQLTGHIKATPVYVETEGKRKKLVIHQKNKGEMGQTLADLVYIKSIVFGEPTAKPER